MNAQIVGTKLASASAFAEAGGRYWLDVFPVVCREVAHWQSRARRIPDPELRRLALENLREERGNLDGAAAFATFVPQARRSAVARALVAFQAAYDYLDTLVERPSGDPIRNGRQLHRALLLALDPQGRDVDYYAHHPRREDGGYLRELVGTCRAAFASLPSSAAVVSAAQRATERMIAYQSLNHDEHAGIEALARWASVQGPEGAVLRWWEAAAGAASSLTVFALIAAAAEPAVGEGEAALVEGAYFPWIGALHVLLDSFVDHAQDLQAGQHSLVNHYESPAELSARLRLLAYEAVASAQTLARPCEHLMILTAMACYYLSDSAALAPDMRPLIGGILGAMGPLAAPTMLVLTAKRRLRSCPVVALRVPPLRLYPGSRDRDHRARTAPGYSRESS